MNARWVDENNHMCKTRKLVELLEKDYERRQSEKSSSENTFYFPIFLWVTSVVGLLLPPFSLLPFPLIPKEEYVISKEVIMLKFVSSSTIALEIVNFVKKRSILHYKINYRNDTQNSSIFQ